MPTIKVKRMTDDKELIYCAPQMTREKALINAYEQLRGNYNTWAYPDKPQQELEKSGMGRVIMGELVAWEDA